MDPGNQWKERDLNFQSADLFESAAQVDGRFNSPRSSRVMKRSRLSAGGDREHTVRTEPRRAVCDTGKWACLSDLLTGTLKKCFVTLICLSLEPHEDGCD